MLEIVGGTHEEKPLNHYQLKTQQLIEEYLEARNLPFKDYLKMVASSWKELNVIYARQEIEMARYKTTSYPYEFKDEGAIIQFHFFGSMIGLFDRCIEAYKKEIGFNATFNNEKEVNEYESHKENILVSREEVLGDFYKNLSHPDSDIIKEVFSHTPAYESFDKLYSTFNLKCVELVSAYNTGYLEWGNWIPIYKDFVEIFALYKKLLNEIEELQVSHQQNVEKEKVKTKKIEG